ncbi:MAG: hypothetical protein C0P76_014980, partial [Acidimicrobiia bacterium]
DLLTNGRLRFTWSVNGQSGAANISSTVSVTPPASGRLAVRATLDVNNGAGGRTIRFYTAPSIAGPWTQLGNPVTQGGTTSIHPGTAPLTVGAYNAGASEPFVGRVWAAEVRDGIDGSLVAAADFTQLAEGTTAFTDATGRNWTIAGNARIVAAPVVMGAAESAVTASGGASGLRRVVGTAASEAGGSAVATGVRRPVVEIGDGADVTVTESLLPESVVESSGAVSVTPEPAGAVNLAESDRTVSVAEPPPSVLVEEPL